jgi:nicotinate-nucleotide adenylyltransferase
LVRGGPSYTVDTIASVRSELGADLPICLLVGADAFAVLADWHRPLEILSQVHLVVMQRPGSITTRDGWLRDQVNQRRATDPAALRARPAGHIFFDTVTQLDISSTRIRRLLATGESPRYLLPNAVLERVVRDGYYTQPQAAPKEHQCNSRS